MKAKILALAAAALGAGACAAGGAYVPEERATATLGGRTAARYPLSASGAAKGDVRVASSGIRDVKLAPGADEEIEAVHVRIAVANTGQVPMTLDVREQRIQFPDGRRVAPAVARSPSGGAPIVTIPAASSRSVDVYFPVEPEDDDPRQFDLVWRLRVGDSTITEITPFDEVDIDPAVARQEWAADAYWGRYPYSPGDGWYYGYPFGWW